MRTRIVFNIYKMKELDFLFLKDKDNNYTSAKKVPRDFCFWKIKIVLLLLIH